VISASTCAPPSTTCRSPKSSSNLTKDSQNLVKGQKVGTKIREPPKFHRVNDLESFLTQYKDEVLENQRLLVLYITLKETPARSWGAHKETIKDWYRCKRVLHIRFGTEQRSNQL
jgi:hypothetical protein